MEALHFLFGILGNLTAMFLYLSPVTTFRRIIKSKSTQDFSGAPYTWTLLNCLISGWYGLPFVSPHNLPVITVNGTGVVFESIYVAIFLIYAPKKVKVKIMGLLIFSLSVFSTVALVSLLALHGQKRRLFCGFAAAIVSVVMSASPLSIMRLVIRTKSVEFMPFSLSLAVFLCRTLFFIFGLLGHDTFVAVPNGLGCGLGAVQLILYAIYRDKRGGKERKAPEGRRSAKGNADGDSIEIDHTHKPPPPPPPPHSLSVKPSDVHV